jgi:hypothetical protein
MHGNEHLPKNKPRDSRRDDRAASPCMSSNTHKSERASSLARPRPLCSDFRRSGSASRSQRLSSRNHSAPTSDSPCFTSLFYDHTHCKSFRPSSVSSCVDRVSLPILEGRRSSALSFWKITLPLKAILLSSNGNASGSGNFLLWKWRHKKWKLDPSTQCWVPQPRFAGCLQKSERASSLARTRPFCSDFRRSGSGS